MTEPLLWCRSCRKPRPSSEMLEVVRVSDGVRTFVCRPLGNGTSCFAQSVRSRADEVISPIASEVPS